MRESHENRHYDDEPQPSPADTYIATIRARDAWRALAEAQAVLLSSLAESPEVARARQRLRHLGQDTSNV